MSRELRKAAKGYLEGLGWMCESEDYTSEEGFSDLVMVDPEGTRHFITVELSKFDCFGLDADGRKAMEHAALSYTHQVNDKRPIAFDAIQFKETADGFHMRAYWDVLKRMEVA